MKIIHTGATGMVGEGVLIECIAHPQIEEILIVSRKPSGYTDPKIKEYIVPEFLNLANDDEHLRGYDAVLFCSGISSAGMKEDEYTRITYDTTMHFATIFLQLNPDSIFCFVSGAHTDGTGEGKTMWARVKGKTENALKQLAFKHQYNFRPGLMKVTAGQKNVHGLNRVIKHVNPLFGLFIPVVTLKEVGLAMINCALYGYPKNVLEVEDLKIASALTGEIKSDEAKADETKVDEAKIDEAKIDEAKPDEAAST